MRILQLIRLQIKVNFHLSALRWYYRNDRKKFVKSLGLPALVGIAIAPVFFLYLRLLGETMDTAIMLGQPEIVLTSALVLSSLLVFMFGIVFVMSVFYFSKDLSTLVPLPFHPGDLLGSKFIVVLIYDYLTIFPFFLPALWVFGRSTGAGPMYWIKGALVYLLIPVIPLTLASVFILLLMHLTNLSKRRDMLRIIGLFLSVFIVLAFNFFITSIPEGEEAEFFENILMEDQAMVNFTSRVYPPARAATQALSSGGWEGLISFGLLLGSSLAGVAVMLLLGRQIFYRGLIGGEEIHQGKALSSAELERKTGRVAPIVWTIAMREIRYLVRTPIFLFNSVAMVAIVPLLFIFPVLSGGSMDQLVNAFQELDPPVAQMMGGALLIAVMALFVPAASSSFSREGRLFWISQVIPVPPRHQIHGKILYSFLLTLLILPMVVLMAIFIVGWSLPEILIVLGGGVVLSFPAITLSLLIDLLRPYLTWDSPQKAIKQNVNVILAMVAGGGMYYLLYLLGRTVYFAFESELPVYGAVLGGSALLGALFYGTIMKIAKARYSEIRIQ